MSLGSQYLTTNGTDSLIYQSPAGTYSIVTITVVNAGSTDTRFSLNIGGTAGPENFINYQTRLVKTQSYERNLIVLGPLDGVWASQTQAGYGSVRVTVDGIQTEEETV